MQKLIHSLIFLFFATLAFGQLKTASNQATTKKDTIATKDNAKNNTAHFIGEEFKGGIVAYVWEKDGIQHGLICALRDQSTSADWYHAYAICDTLTLDNYKHWRLPNKDELNEMYINLYQKGLGSFASDFYWSATDDEDIPHVANAQYFKNGAQINYGKGDSKFYVRAVRGF